MDTTPKDAVYEFMLAEFNAIQTHVVRIEEAKSTRVNFYLIIVASTIAGISALANVPNFQQQLSTLAAVTTLGLFILGIGILNQLIQYSEVVSQSN